VLLADTSDLGRKTVNEYETNHIASNSDNERRIINNRIAAVVDLHLDKSLVWVIQLIIAQNVSFCRTTYIE
jgi:hypothetical protein